MNITRMGHYHVPGSPGEKGACQAALVVGIVKQDPIRAVVNLVVWDSDGDQFTREGVEQADPLGDHGKATFHLSQECPHGK